MGDSIAVAFVQARPLIDSSAWPAIRNKQGMADMLPDVRFVLGAGAAAVMLAVAAFGVVTSVRLAREVRIGPLEPSRSMAFAERADWNALSQSGPAKRPNGRARDPNDVPTLREAAERAVSQPVLPDLADSSLAAQVTADPPREQAGDPAPSDPLPETAMAASEPPPAAAASTEPRTTAEGPMAAETKLAGADAPAAEAPAVQQAEQEKAPALAPAEAAAAPSAPPPEPGTTGSIKSSESREISSEPAADRPSEPAPAPEAMRTAAAPAAETPTPANEAATGPTPAAGKVKHAPRAAKSKAAPKKTVRKRPAKPKPTRTARKLFRPAPAAQTGYPLGSPTTSARSQTFQGTFQ
jgi:hypothetical protein